MICKWCGATMDAQETVCRRCGREAPAKSDCGGFYDLVPDARGIVPPACVQPPMPQPVAEPPKKSAVPLVLGLVCCLLVVVCAVAFLSGNNAKNEVKRLEQELEDMSQGENVPLNEQDIEVTLCLTEDEDTYDMKVDCDTVASVLVKCIPTAKKGITGYTAELTISDAEEGVAVLQLEQGPSAEEILLQADLSKDFGKVNHAYWTMFYVGENGKLEELNQAEPQGETGEETETDGDPNPFGDVGEDASEPADAAVQEIADPDMPVPEITTENGVVLRVPYAYLKAAAKAAQLPDDTEFVYTLLLENKEGGSFTIHVEGITLADES